jgi:uncharacterized protein (DUF3820 family)
MPRRKTRKNYLAKLPESYRDWLRAAETFGLGTAHVKMALELKIPPRFLAIFAKHPEQTGGRSLADYIEHRYRSEFQKEPPGRLPELETILVNEWRSKIRERAKRRERVEKAKSQRSS